MKITVKKTVEEEVEVKLPYFFKTLTSYVAVLSEKKTVTVSALSSVSSVAIYQTGSVNTLCFDMEDSVEITAAEFHDQMLSAINNITIELHNIAALQQNEFIKNENLKSEGY